MPTVTLEYRGALPCEVIGERWHMVTVHADYGRPLPVRYALLDVRLACGEVVANVAAERVSGWRAPRPIAGSGRHAPGVQHKRGESHRVTVAGVVHKSLAAACRTTGTNYRTARERVRAGYPPAVAVLRWER